MIYLKNAKRFCKEYYLIENYQEAVNDTERMWDCHHIHEIDWVLPREELISIGRYYDVHYSELIFLTPEEHMKLHHKGKVVSEETKQKISNTMRGKQHTEEAKAKIRDARKGQKRAPFSDEWKQNIGDSHTKYHITEEELYDLYVVQELSVYRIAKMYGCPQCCIWLKLKKYNISKSNKY